MSTFFCFIVARQNDVNCEQASNFSREDLAILSDNAIKGTAMCVLLVDNMVLAIFCIISMYGRLLQCNRANLKHPMAATSSFFSSNKRLLKASHCFKSSFVFESKQESHTFIGCKIPFRGSFIACDTHLSQNVCPQLVQPKLEETYLLHFLHEDVTIIAGGSSTVAIGIKLLSNLSLLLTVIFSNLLNGRKFCKRSCILLSFKQFISSIGVCIPTSMFVPAVVRIVSRTVFSL